MITLPSLHNTSKVLLHEVVVCVRYFAVLASDNRVYYLLCSDLSPSFIDNDPLPSLPPSIIYIVTTLPSLLIHTCTWTNLAGIF
jgi:hypothetical protein